MYTQGAKKLLIINILDILKKYTDSEHKLLQKEIIEILEQEYSMTAERKAIKNNITSLIEWGYDIEYDNGWYIHHEFEESEIRLLIDSVLFSKNIPCNQCHKLIKKLKGLTSKYFDAKVEHICNMPENRMENKQLFYTIEVLNEAISKERQVAFLYNNFSIEKKLCPRRETKYVVNPYQIVATNGRYYLICNYDKYDDFSHYRLDRMTEIELLETKAKPQKYVKGLENGLDLPKHMAEHIYMFAGESVRVKFKASSAIISEIIDWFGKDVRFTNETQEECEVSVTVNPDAMCCWALQYGQYVEVLEPQSLREKLKEIVKGMDTKYNSASEALVKK